MKKLLVALSALLLSCAVEASTPQLEMPVTYHPNAGVVERVRTECQIEGMLANQVGSQMKRVFKTQDVYLEKGGDPAGRPTLRLQITHVLGVGGGAWTGPKAITVSAELLGEDGQVRRTKISRWSVGGFWGGFRGTCSILERCAVVIGKELTRWVKDPSFRIKELPPPTEAEMNAAATSGEGSSVPNEAVEPDNQVQEPAAATEKENASPQASLPAPGEVSRQEHSVHPAGT